MSVTICNCIYGMNMWNEALAKRVKPIIKSMGVEDFLVLTLLATQLQPPEPVQLVTTCRENTAVILISGSGCL